MPDNAELDSSDLYTARLIEGYDISTLRSLSAVPATAPEGAYLARRLQISDTGSLSMNSEPISKDEAADRVALTVHETIDHYELLSECPSIVIGLSGGVDSTSLLMLLAEYRDAGHDIELHAATFEDFDARYSDTFDFAAKLAANNLVHHDFVAAATAERVFNLRAPLAYILEELMGTADAHLTMYVDHHTTRRLLEDYAERQAPGARIALGLHATDLLAGRLNGLVSGHPVGPTPRRSVGRHTYVYPLTFVPKRELHMFYTERTGLVPAQTTPNRWEFNPTDRNFLYYMADHIQWLWPGIQHWVLTAENPKADAEVEFHRCENCDGEMKKLQDASGWTGICDVCAVLQRNGWLR